jgi:hypothetical protein
MPTPRAPRWLAAAASLAVLAAAPIAAAQVSDKAVAEALFQEGRDLMEQGKTAEACSRFEQSQKLEAKLGTLLNLGLCHEQLGKTATAWGELTEAAELAHRSHEDKREAFARDHAQALEAKLSKLVLSRAADGAKDVTLILDGRALDASIAGTPLPLDPGKHVVEARAPGRQTWTGSVDLPPGPARVLLPIPHLEPAAPPPPAMQPPPALPPAVPQAPVVLLPPQPRPTEPPSSGVPAAAWVGFGVAVAGVIVGGAAGAISLGQTSSVRADCGLSGATCPSTDSGKLSSANGLANVSNVSFALAGVGAIVGGVAIALTPPGKTGPRASLVIPLGSPGAALRLRF